MFIFEAFSTSHSSIIVVIKLINPVAIFAASCEGGISLKVELLSSITIISISNYNGTPNTNKWHSVDYGHG